MNWSEIIGYGIALVIAGAIYFAIAAFVFYVLKTIWLAVFPLKPPVPSPIQPPDYQPLIAAIESRMAPGNEPYLKACLEVVIDNFPIPEMPAYARENPTWWETQKLNFERATSEQRQQEWVERFDQAGQELLRGMTPLAGKGQYGNYWMSFGYAFSEQSVRGMMRALTKDDLFPKLKRDYAERLEHVEKHKETGQAAIRCLLHKTPLACLKKERIEFSIPDLARFEGTWIIAPPGRGKTTLLSMLLYDDISRVRDGNASVIIMDSKGDLLDNVRQYISFAKGNTLEGKLVLIEPSENLALNPFDLGATTGHTIELLEYVFASLLDSKQTALQSTLFRSLVIAMQGIPDANFGTFRTFLIEGWRPFEQYIRRLDPEDAEFFLKGEFDSDTYKSTRRELLWRVRDLTTRVPMLRKMFRAPKTRIDISALMDAGKVILIDNSKKLLGDDGSEFFARFFVALILGAAQQRTGRAFEQKLPVYFYIDEAQTVISKDEKIASIIHECRSQNIATIFAHQELSQIESPTVRGALANCAIRWANPDKDAKALADDFRTTTEALQSLPKGQFALYIRDYMKEALAFEVKNFPVSKWQKMPPEELELIRSAMRYQFCYYPEPSATVAEEPESTDPGKWG